MPSLRDVGAPAGMVSDVGALCARARQDPDFIYGDLLRENIADALRCSFPRFAAEIGSAQLEASASAFLRNHSAERPQFHHIATEFVGFAQRAMTLPPLLMELLEYEWALLAVEIDPADVNARKVSDDWPAQDRSLMLNPTARLLVLPLGLIRPQEPGDRLDADRCACAVYRTRHDCVVTRALSYQDCLLIDQIRSAGSLSLGALVTRVLDHLSADDVRQWAAECAASDVLHPAPNHHGVPHETVALH